MNSDVQPVKIRRRDPSRVEIDWNDGHTSVFTAAALRRLCPCALCVHELTGEALLDPRSISDDMTQREVRLVGNYAISLHFSDGHQTGIFTFPYLRESDDS